MTAKALAVGGLTVIAGGTLFAGVGATAPAYATATGCTAYGTNGEQCMTITGNGNYVSGAYESAFRPYLDNICNYQAKWYGDYPPDGGWTTFYGSKVDACYHDFASEAAGFFTYFKANTYFYGYWDSKYSGGWSNPVRETIE